MEWSGLKDRGNWEIRNIDRWEVVGDTSLLWRDVTMQDDIITCTCSAWMMKHCSLHLYYHWLHSVLASIGMVSVGTGVLETMVLNPVLICDHFCGDFDVSFAGLLCWKSLWKGFHLTLSLCSTNAALCHFLQRFFVVTEERYFVNKFRQTDMSCCSRYARVVTTYLRLSYSALLRIGGMTALLTISLI